MTNPKPTFPPTNNNLQANNESQEIISIGTRKSQLAIAQAKMIIAQLETVSPGPQYKLQVISTMADENQVKTFLEFNSKSIWTEELEGLLVDGKLDVVVHCLKGRVGFSFLFFFFSFFDEYGILYIGNMCFLTLSLQRYAHHPPLIMVRIIPLHLPFPFPPKKRKNTYSSNPPQTPHPASSAQSASAKIPETSSS